MKIVDSTADDQPLYDRMLDEMIPLVREYCVAIAAYYNGELHQHATGTLVRFSDHYFRVTAAHAIQDFDVGRQHYSDMSLYIDNGNSENIVSLFGQYRATQVARDPDKPKVRFKNDRDDILDIGIWKLDRRTVSALTNKRFLCRKNISLTSNLSQGTYFLAGCPCSWAQADSRTKSAHWKWLRYVTHPYSEGANLPDYDERIHIALRLGDDPFLPQKLQGISGCSIWKLSDEEPTDSWRALDAKVVAIQTCIYADRQIRAFRGTTWSSVLRVIVSMCPEIRESFKLILPGAQHYSEVEIALIDGRAD